jgi:WD40 repeat protein
LFFCSSLQEKVNKLKDSITLFRGTVDKTLNTILSNSLPEFDEGILLNRRVPEVSLTLDHVYGFEAFDRRKTLRYVEFYKDKWTPSFREIYPYYEPHTGSSKSFVYFISRVAIVQDSLKMTQRFYEGHMSKISCLAIHPNKKDVATGETAENPQIHIWNSQHCSLKKVITTNHGAGIINMAFSRCGTLVFSVGMDKNFSLQVTDWKLEEIIAFRNSSQNAIIDLVVNPYDKYEFATCGYHKVQLWEVQGKSIILKENINITEGDKNQLPYITCIDYIYYMMQDEIRKDLIVGTNLGDLGLVSRGSYILTRKTAHKKMINCILISDVFKDVPFCLNLECNYHNGWRG